MEIVSVKFPVMEMYTEYFLTFFFLIPLGIGPYEFSERCKHFFLRVAQIAHFTYRKWSQIFEPVGKETSEHPGAGRVIFIAKQQTDGGYKSKSLSCSTLSINQATQRAR